MNICAFNDSIVPSSKGDVSGPNETKDQPQNYGSCFSDCCCEDFVFVPVCLAKRFVTANDRNINKLKCYSQRTETDKNLAAYGAKLWGAKFEGNYDY
jgi:hypothetical protein